MRLIDADALLKKAMPKNPEAQFRCVSVNDIINAPTIEAQPERKTGKWTKISPALIYECSECGQHVLTADIDAYKFCHGCGCRMLKEGD